MAYIALKNFEINGNKYKIGDTVKDSDVEGRLIRAKKIKDTEAELGTVTYEQETVETNETPAQVEEIVEDVIEAEEPIEELLTEESSDVEVQTENSEEK